jgi:hypothetical protein
LPLKRRTDYGVLRKPGDRVGNNPATLWTRLVASRYRGRHQSSCVDGWERIDVADVGL